jgi:hypothetical protein
VLFREVEGEVVFLNLNNKSYFGLDEIGTRMWNVLTTSASVQEAHNILMAEYDVSSQQLGHDLEQFILHLQQVGLITTTSP